ncbi:MAG: rhodanese-like domain-containing protein [Lacibacter sp.]
MKQHFLLLTVLLTGVVTQAQVRNVTAAEVEQRIRQKDVVVLDVRTADEYNEGHLPGAQLHDVLQSTQFVNAVKQLPRNKTYVVYCHSGRRSLEAARIMEALGFRSVLNMTGGILAWKGTLTKNKN